MCQTDKAGVAAGAEYEVDARPYTRFSKRVDVTRGALLREDDSLLLGWVQYGSNIARVRQGVASVATPLARSCNDSAEPSLACITLDLGCRRRYNIKTSQMLPGLLGLWPKRRTNLRASEANNRATLSLASEAHHYMTTDIQYDAYPIQAHAAPSTHGNLPRRSLSPCRNLRASQL